MGSPFFTIFILFIYLLLFYRVPPITLPPLRSGAPPLLTVGLLHVGSSVSLGSSLPQHGALSHRTQVRGSSPSSHGPATTGAVFHPGCSALPLSLPLSPWGSSPSRSLNCGASPHLCGASTHRCGALHHFFVGLRLAVGLFPISLTQLRGFPTSLWGSSHLAHSTVGPTHICVGLFTIFPWVFISLWGSSPSRSLNCGASPHSLSPWSFLSLRGSSLSRSLNCTLTQLWHSTGSCILLLALSSRGGVVTPSPHTPYFSLLHLGFSGVNHVSPC